MIRKVEPYRLCEGRNEERGYNQLRMIIGHLLPASFAGSIESLEDEQLAKAYVNSRYGISYNPGRMVSQNPQLFTANEISKYDRLTEKLTTVRPIGLAGQLDIPELDDTAQRNMFDYILTTAERLGLPQGVRSKLVQVPPTNRLLFVQASIGTGKSTMLRYFSRCVAPSLNKNEEVPIEIYTSIVDLNTFSLDEQPSKIWPKILNSYRNSLSEELKTLDTTAGWLKLSEYLIKNKDGEFLPAVELDPKGVEHAKKRIAHQCSDDATYLQRLAYHLAVERNSVLVLICDNIDRQGPRVRQLKLIDRFTALLGEIPFSVGVISVRESTLGSLGQLDRFAGYLRISSLHLTAPLIGQVVQKRIDQLIEKIKKSPLQRQPLQDFDVGEEITISMDDVSSFLRHVRTAFASTVEKLDSASFEEVPQVSIERFLPYANHSNIRSAVSTVINVLESWALAVDIALREFVYQRDTKQKRRSIKLPVLTTDEFIRVGAVGRFRYFDHTEEPELFNVFCFGRKQPNAVAGRFPVLITYRTFEFFMSGSGRKVSDFYEAMRCFGFSRDELTSLLQTLINWLFIESRDSAKLNEIKTLFRTKKLEYYFTTLCVNTTYVENVRNDCLIEYESTPHEVRTGLYDDMHELCKFTWYLLEQEKEEFKYVSGRGTGGLRRYRSIVHNHPLSARMYRSFILRYQSLVRRRKGIDPRSDVIKNEFRVLRSHMLEASTQKAILQEISPVYLPIP